MNKKNLGVGTLEITPNAIKYVNEALKNERLSYGFFIKKFEQKLSSAHGCKFGVMVNSGTSALSIAVACLKETEEWQDGDEIIVPAVTFIASSNVIIEHNLRPIFVDVDPLTYNIDHQKIEEKITKRTRAIMVVHLFGQPAEMDPIIKISKKYKLKLIEDSAETMIAKYKGMPVGSFGDISCFSTYVAHLVVTGVGGLAATKNPTYAEILRSLANHGRDGIYIDIDDDKDKSDEILKEIISRRFHFIRRGYSFRVTELEGALGLAQLEVIIDNIKKRQKNAQYLTKSLKKYDNKIQLPYISDYSEHVFMMYPIVLKKEIIDNRNGIQKVELVNYLEQNGIETRDMLPLINQPFYIEMFGFKKGDYPVADWINDNGFYIGCHQKMGKEELNYILKFFDEFFQE